jgi:hypothetical protein
MLADEPRGPKDGQVLGDCRAADRHAFRKPAHRGRTASEPVDDRATGRIAKNIKSAWVRFHGR